MTLPAAGTSIDAGVRAETDRSRNRPDHGHGVFLVVVAPEPQGGRLGWELISRQNAELREPAEGITGGSVVGHARIAMLVL